VQAPFKEVEIYDRFALDLARGSDVVDRETYEVIIDSRRKEQLKRWLAGKTGLLLDYGCGDGSFSRFLKEELKIEVVSIDISAGIVRYAAKQGKDVNYLITDCHALPFKNNSFDAVVSIGVFHHLDLRKAGAESYRVLRKEGVLAAFEPNSLGLISFVGRKLLKTKIHTPEERTYTYWSFIDEMKLNGFKIVDLRFLSFLAFIFPFIWASKFSNLLTFLKKRANLLKAFDQLMEKSPITKQLCWQFGCKCESS